MEQQEVLFRRMPHPGLGLVDHATRIGVRLKSSALLPAGTRDVTSRLSQRSSAHNTSMTSRAATRTPLSSRARKSPQRIAAPNTPPVTYIHNIVVPLNAPMDEMNLVSTTNTQAFRAFGTRARSTMVNRRGKSQSPVSTVQNSTVRSYSAASAQGDTQDASTVHAEATSIGRDASQWNRSEQASRYASGQESVSLSRTRKRTSEACSTAGFTSYDDPNEIQPHRVDRAYYMSGTNLSLRNRYIVDESELSQLKEMATARRQAKQYGRGLSEVPRQPPPSSMGDAETVPDCLLAEDAVINDTRTVADDQQGAPPPEPDEAIDMDAQPAGLCEQEVADMNESVGLCDQSRAAVENSPSEQEISSDGPPVDVPPDLVLGEEGQQNVQKAESSLETQRDSASVPALDSSRRTGSVLTLTGTDVSTARSDPWQGAILERQAETDLDIDLPVNSEQEENEADSRIDQSETPVETDDLEVAQSETPSEHAMADDNSISEKESVVELAPDAEVEQPVIESCSQEEEKPTDCSSSNTFNSKPSKNTSDCQQSQSTCSKQKEPSKCSGSIENECNGKKTVPTIKKAKQRPLSPCQGH